jgi:hypothetical protein
MTWSAQQEAAIKAVLAWYRDENAPQVFRLFGYAGTGKTTIAHEIARVCEYEGKHWGRRKLTRDRWRKKSVTVASDYLGGPSSPASRNRWQLLQCPLMGRSGGFP